MYLEKWRAWTLFDSVARNLRCTATLVRHDACRHVVKLGRYEEVIRMRSEALVQD